MIAEMNDLYIKIDNVEKALKKLIEIVEKATTGTTSTDEEIEEILEKKEETEPEPQAPATLPEKKPEVKQQLKTLGKNPNNPFKRQVLNESNVGYGSD